MCFQLQLEMCGFFILHSMPREIVLLLVTTKEIYLNLTSTGIGKSTQDWILIEKWIFWGVIVQWSWETSSNAIKWRYTKRKVNQCQRSSYQSVMKCNSARKLPQNVTISLFSRFNLVQRTGTPSTAIAFSLRRRSEFLVGMADYSLKCFDTGQWNRFHICDDEKIVKGSVKYTFVMMKRLPRHHRR